MFRRTEEHFLIQQSKANWKGRAEDADGPCGIRETVVVDSELCRGSRRFPEYIASDSQSISHPMISMESQKKEKTKDPPPYILETESWMHCPEFSARP